MNCRGEGMALGTSREILVVKGDKLERTSFERKKVVRYIYTRCPTEAQRPSDAKERKRRDHRKLALETRRGGHVRFGSEADLEGRSSMSALPPTADVELLGKVREGPAAKSRLRGGFLHALVGV